jgi:hypothetical protein
VVSAVRKVGLCICCEVRTDATAVKGYPKAHYDAILRSVEQLDAIGRFNRRPLRQNPPYSTALVWPIE